MPAKKVSAKKTRQKKAASLVGRKAKAVKCAACGAAPGKAHVAGCPNSRCSDCKMMAGSHELKCPHHPNNVKAAGEKTTVLDGKTGGPVIDTDVDGQPAKIDTRGHDGLRVVVDTETLLMELAQKQQLVNQRKSERGRASNALKEALESRDATIGVLAQRGYDLREPKLPGVEDAGVHVDTTDDEEEDGVEDEALA